MSWESKKIQDHLGLLICPVSYTSFRTNGRKENPITRSVLYNALGGHIYIFNSKELGLA